ncbi:hypothetical protein [Haloarchaeobius sp. DT45]|uniref:hypothetical protein n=1 Tax=Haloarchaeobius sp. DT45 TaxID=3446116 RepID=UPI003F6C6D15
MAATAGSAAVVGTVGASSEPTTTAGSTTTTGGTSPTAGTTGTRASDAGTTGTTSGGGATIRRQMAFAEPEAYEGEYVGDYLVVTDQVTAAVDTGGVSQCDLTGWDPSNTVVYEAVLTDTLARDPEGAEVRVVVDGTNDPIESGSVFVISTADTCEGGYVGVGTESVSNARIPAGAETTAPKQDEGAGGPLPGFEGAGAVTAILAVLGLARRRD